MTKSKAFLPLTLLLLSVLSACSAPTEPTESTESDSTEQPATEEIISSTLTALEAAHKKSTFDQKEAIQFDIELFFRGKKRLDATITSLTNSGKIRMEKADGTVVVFDGNQVLQMPADTDYKGARFDIFTWQYFFMAPYKLSDPGTIWTDISRDTLNTLTYERGKLTFEAGTGDAPDDWYVIYKNPKTNLMDVLAYIVTYGQSAEEAEEEPHAVTYEAYQTFEGIPIATKWGFWIWYEDQGLTEQLGEANVSNVKFVDGADTLFSLGEDAKVIARN